MADAKGERLRCVSRSSLSSTSRPSSSRSRSSAGSSTSSGRTGSSLKLSSHFQLLDKMNVSSAVRTLSSEDLQQVRQAASKILQHVIAQEKSGREHVVKNSFYIQSMLTSLEPGRDFEVCKTVVNVFVELIGKTNTGSRCSQLVSQGATQVFCQLLAREARSDVPDDFIFQLHYVLSKLSLKGALFALLDRKFGVKARLSQALPVTLSFIRNHTHTAAIRNLQPVLNVLKAYANNAINSSYLGKNGIINHLFKIISNINKKNAIMTKTALDTMVLLVKSKSNSARAVGYGGVPILLQMYCDWHKLDTKNRHVSLRKSLLNILKHITNLKSGRQAVIDADGVRVLYRTCEDIMDVRELESLIFIASLILRKCFPRQKLPANATKTTLLYKLPESEFHTPQGLSKDAAQLNGITLTVDTKDDDDSSLDNDDDLSSDDDADCNKPTSGNCAADRPDECMVGRFLDDLRMYEKFFPEVLDIEVADDLSSETDPELSILLNEAVSVSSTGGLRPNPYSMPNLSATKSNHREELKDFPAMKHVDSVPSGLAKTPAPSTGYKIREFFEGGVSAVNMKTGQPVFSLDFQVPSRSMRSKAKTPTLVDPRTKTRKSEKSARTGDLLLPDLDQLQIDPLLDEGDDSEFSAEEWVKPEDFFEAAKRTVSVGRFNKVAYPDLHGSKPIPKKEPLYEQKFGVQRAKIFEDIDRMINPDALLNRVVYDFDETVKDAGNSFHGGNTYYANHDVARLGKAEAPYDHLHFNSHFESGNLRKSIQVRETEYDLILCPDTNSNHHHQWFYFEVSNMVAGKSYRFNIINNEKTNSQFNFGMQPVMYSVQAAVDGEPYWSRVGTDICYFKNHLARSSQVTGGVRGKLYFTTTFSITFEHSYDVCYLAYHYPYTYTTLQCQLARWQNAVDQNLIYFKNQVLCQSVSGNDLNVLTITNYPPSNSKEAIEQFRNKPYIFLSCRVHPGEPNASWIMKGTIEHLLSDSAEATALRSTYIFKIVPMLNPDGVINGNHRCSLAAEDLNRRWMVTCPKLHPTIYHTKGMLQFMRQMQRTPLIYCDYHGHSRRKNVFLYGCSPALSWMTEDIDNPAVLGDKTEDYGYKTLPKVLSQTAPAFSLSSCSFAVEKSKETTARVVVWRQIGVVRSYTMESSYCGCDQGPYMGLHINISHLQHMGSRFADALLKLKSRHYKVKSSDDVETTSDESKCSVFASSSSSKTVTSNMNYVDEEYADDNISDDMSDEDDDDEELNDEL